MSKIIGYRELDEHDIALINTIKKLAEEVENEVESLVGYPPCDQRWLAIAKTDLQKGFMSLVRSIAKPNSF